MKVKLTNPASDKEASYRNSMRGGCILRGGDYDDVPIFIRAFYRYYFISSARLHDKGFRLVRNK